MPPNNLKGESLVDWEWNFGWAQEHLDPHFYARNAPLRILLTLGHMIFVYNTQYRRAIPKEESAEQDLKGQ